jgi:hypothetical protein
MSQKVFSDTFYDVYFFITIASQKSFHDIKTTFYDKNRMSYKVIFLVVFHLLDHIENTCPGEVNHVSPDGQKSSTIYVL